MVGAGAFWCGKAACDVVVAGAGCRSELKVGSGTPLTQLGWEAFGIHGSAMGSFHCPVCSHD